MSRFVGRSLADRGYVPVFAYYEPYSCSPALSVPAYGVFRRNVTSRFEKMFGRYEAHAIGAWLPEFEFMHYVPTQPWTELMESCDYHIVVSGNCLPGLPLARTERKFFSWIASSWEGDREARVCSYPWLRRMFDRVTNRVIVPCLERLILKTGTTLALSQFTRLQLDKVNGGKVVDGVLSPPIDTGLFVPNESMRIPGRIGFTGRFNDPRKNVRLLVEAMRICRERDYQVTAQIVGTEPNANLSAKVRSLGLGDHVTFVPYLSEQALLRCLQTMDIFVIPSAQEGLCVSALEAMACGCPVVSTRCGGPEEYVREGETGYLVDANPAAMADQIGQVIRSAKLRRRLSQGARNLVRRQYSRKDAEQLFWEAFEQTFCTAT